MAYVSGAPRDPTAVVGRRITAYLIDGLLGLIVLAVVLAMVKHDSFTDAPANACSILRARNPDNSTCVNIASRALLWKRGDFLTAIDVAALITVLNLVVLQAVTGASVGKHALGLVVVDEKGNAAGFGRTIVRWLLLVLDGGIFLIGLIAMLSTRFHRRIGDLAAGTFVVAKSSAGQPVGFAPPSVPYGGSAFAAPALPTVPTPLAPGWGHTQVPAPPVPVEPLPHASSSWNAPPSPTPLGPAPTPRPPSMPPAPASAPPTPVPPPSPQWTPPPNVPPPTNVPPPQSAPPPAAPAAPTPTPAPTAPPAAPRLPSTQPAEPKRQTVPQPESWWDTAIPDDPADGEEQR
jgi:hypothetical protein